MPGSYPYAGKYPAQNERCEVYGISEREEQPDDISKMGEVATSVEQKNG